MRAVRYNCRGKYRNQGKYPVLPPTIAIRYSKSNQLLYKLYITSSIAHPKITIKNINYLLDNNT